ncbi:MAG TPA: hypothetical protein VHE37_08740 [Nevskiaceae bacterium]|nr:hypothetical protein [Nevskiaceae bacterium]
MHRKIWKWMLHIAGGNKLLAIGLTVGGIVGLQIIGKYEVHAWQNGLISPGEWWWLLDTEKAAAWAQAVFGVIGLATAIWVPFRLQQIDREKERLEEFKRRLFAERIIYSPLVMMAEWMSSASKQIGALSNKVTAESGDDLKKAAGILHIEAVEQLSDKALWLSIEDCEEFLKIIGLAQAYRDMIDSAFRPHSEGYYFFMMNDDARRNAKTFAAIIGERAGDLAAKFAPPIPQHEKDGISNHPVAPH